MTKQIQSIRAAIQKGYTADPIRGQILGLRNFWGKRKPLKLKLKGQQRYPTVSFRLPEYDQPVKSVPAHRFMAYVVFGEEALLSAKQVRHLNGNVLDIRGRNLALGSQVENYQDQLQITVKRVRLLWKLLGMISNPNLRQALYEFEQNQKKP